MKLNKIAKTLLATAALAGSLVTSTAATAGTYEYSRYTGWELWAYINDSGILDKWNAKYNEDVKIEYVGDYIQSLDNFKNGNSMGVTATNIDAMGLFASAGVPSEALINGSYSNGNDGVIVRNGNSCKDLEGMTVQMAEFSVSDYATVKCLQSVGLTRDDIQVENAGDGDIANLYTQDPNVTAVATWNPPLQVIKTQNFDAVEVFSSKQIPFEILDTMYVNPNAPESEKKVLVGAWFEALSHIQKRGSKRTAAIKYMAKNSGASPAQFKQQLSTTKFLNAKEQIEFASGAKIKSVTADVRDVVNAHFLPKASMASNINIQFADGSVVGDASKVRITYPTKYAEMALNGKL